MAAEDVLRLHPQLPHLRRTVPVSTAEELLQRLRGDRGDRAPGRPGVLPDRGGQPDGKPDGEHRPLVRDRDPARLRGPGDVAAGLPLRAAQPPGQHPGRLSRRDPGFQQAGGRVDMRRVLRGTRAAIPRHDMKILQITSNSRQMPAACPHHARSPARPASRDRAIHDAIVSAVEVSSPASQPATRRSHAPSSTPSSTPARIADRSSSRHEPARSRLQRPRRHRRRSPATLQPPVTQRNLEAEIAFCVGGVITPPWGVPSPVGANPFPASKIPAFSHPAIISLRGEDRRSPPARCSWLILSNAPARSASRIHTRLDFPRKVLNSDSIASWQPRPGRNP